MIRERGVMGFKKINFSFEDNPKEYARIMKERAQLSAFRTLRIRNNNIENMFNARDIRHKENKKKRIEKIKDAIIYFKNNNIPYTKTNIMEKTKIPYKSICRYMKEMNFLFNVDEYIQNNIIKSIEEIKQENKNISLRELSKRTNFAQATISKHIRTSKNKKLIKVYKELKLKNESLKPEYIVKRINFAKEKLRKEGVKLTRENISKESKVGLSTVFKYLAEPREEKMSKINSIKKMQQAKEKLIQKDISITIKSIVNETGLSNTTVWRYFKELK